ncbi:Uncharacterized protein OBRU01_00939 [Operophtera brumata]|uniref:DUF7041 domain-containing protein n=1 Tax=Operophtera brumata TaxID=104452 RepID=A0A0L7LUQ9_OPEBR|nr:Uncharacterized protein OBRU01_00939 [Operophtera brumata]
MFQTPTKASSVPRSRSAEAAADNSAKMDLGSNTELAAITVSARIPEFWAEMPRLWFAQMESIMAPQKQGDENKFNLVISKLGRDALQQFPLGELVTQMHKLNLEVASLREEVKVQQHRRSAFRGRGSRSASRQRSQSRPARNQGDPNWLCRFHFRYRNRAWSYSVPPSPKSRKNSVPASPKSAKSSVPSTPKSPKSSASTPTEGRSWFTWS